MFCACCHVLHGKLQHNMLTLMHGRIADLTLQT